MYSRILDIKIEKQTKEHWCWAAVMQAVITHFYPGQLPSQEDIVTEYFGGINKSSSQLDLPGTLEKLLRHYKVLRFKLNGPVDFETIKQEIDSERCLCIRTRKANGAGHFVLVTGYDEDDLQNRFYITDPANDTGKSVLTPFPIPIEGSTWTTTFLLKQPK